MPAKRLINGFLTKLRNRWGSPAGYREVLQIALPLIFSSSAWSLQHFIDRMLLSWHSPAAIAATMPAGMLNFTFMCLFTGTAGYVSTFVAQYYGARQNQLIGAIVYQGIYVALAGGLVMLALAPLGPWFFTLAGHKGLVKAYEISYYHILCLGSFPPLASAALSGFFNGLGRTKPVMWVTIGATFVNLSLDYLLIFGKAGFPALGVEGAALATVASGVFSLICYTIMILSPSNARLYNTRQNWHFNPKLFLRLLRYGLPTGVQFFLDIVGFTIFLLLVGRLGTVAIAATNITFNINNLAFMPMIGLGITVSTLTGQNLGRNQERLAVRVTYSALHLTALYMGTMILLYIFIPQIFIAPFVRSNVSQDYGAIEQLVKILLRFVAVYSLFDILNIIFSATLKGAGDTRFVMYILGILSFGLLVLPTYLTIVIFQKNIIYAWTWATVYISALGLTFYGRFLQGKWQKMRVIEPVAPILPTNLPTIPTLD